jgi:hypothetical protein
MEQSGVLVPFRGHKIGTNSGFPAIDLGGTSGIAAHFSFEIKYNRVMCPHGSRSPVLTLVIESYL